MRREKMNNKGFSLVELIIVIAIMAILSAALAPQLMKYIEKSRKSTDESSCASIESCVNAALAEEQIYKDVATAGNKTTIHVDIEVKDDGTKLMTCDKSALVASNAKFKEELVGTDGKGGTLGSLKAPKQTGKKYYSITIVTKEGSQADIVEVGNIAVKTSSSPTTTP